ncbi:MAG TPA: type II secretion system F family protein [bacterium]|nr:MAG: Type II secretion system protein F [bacterium ADurb.Bin236]HOY64388.1 type II secretion system F family protein [bacterium]HPI75927.1 type II secretion system F family protein [bacterium]HPN93729.1 type II secretion system F family protein [bacterium]
MPVYNFIARDHAGRNFKGSLFGPSEQAVFFRLQKLGYVVVSVDEKTASDKPPLFQQAITQADVVIFTRLLGTVVASGIPAVDALAAIEEQTANLSFRRIIKEVREDVEHGSTMSAAFEKHPKIFPHLFTAMIHSGEISGTLVESLEKTSGYLERDLELRRAISNAFVYPKIVVTIAVVGIAVILLKFVPTIEGLYKQTPRFQLPVFTKILIDVSHFMTNNVIPIGVFALLLAAAYFLMKNTAAGRPYFEAFVMKLPIAGPLYKRMIIARAVHTLGSMLNCGVPLITSLESVKTVAGNAGIAKDLDRVVENVEAGGTMSSSLRLSPNFPPLVVYMIAAGEQSGKLPSLMTSCAEALEKEIQFMIKRLLIVLEPAITVFIAMIVAFIAIAVYLPFYNVFTMMPK